SQILEIAEAFAQTFRTCEYHCRTLNDAQTSLLPRSELALFLVQDHPHPSRKSE
ncbi:hypothetical protein ALC57_13420, partial [Trachymyrmex cornetzi]